MRSLKYSGIGSGSGKYRERVWMAGLGLAGFLLAFVSPARGQALDALVLDTFDWKMTAEQFEKEWMNKQFEWMSSAKMAARHPGRHHVVDREKKRVIEVRPTMAGTEVGETIVRFKDGMVSRIEVSLFNRGDDEELDEREFDQRIAETKALLTKTAGREIDDGRDNRSAGRSFKSRWSGKTTDYQLEYSFQRAIRNRQPYLAEFISLKLIPSTKNRSLLDAVAAREIQGPKDREARMRNVVKKENGDVVIENVPMVDQGDKGYCAVASAERVFRFYGLEVDQHAMAQLAGSSAGRGTSPDAMVEALQDAAGRLKVHVRTHDAIEEYEDFEKLVKDYNRVAKKNSAKEIPVRAGYILNMMGCYMAFDAESLREAKLKGNDYERFRKLLREQIGEGVPILWSLFLGIYPEKDIPQPSGGHMRLIIGYNDKTEEVLYSDSWGKGHELKRMPMEQAYTMTTGLRTLQPFR